jgi:hypothetical protein
MALTSWLAFPFFQASQVPVPADEEGSYVFDVGCGTKGLPWYRLHLLERDNLPDYRFRRSVLGYNYWLGTHPFACIQVCPHLSSLRLNRRTCHPSSTNTRYRILDYSVGNPVDGSNIEDMGFG